MPSPIQMQLAVFKYLVTQKLKGVQKYPLVMMLEPLFACNLECAGCGKIQHPEHVLRRRMPVEQAVAAIEESGTPMVSIAGGEPLIHPEIHIIAAELVARRKFVYLCTNALLLERKLDKFKPSPYFAWAIHLDGMRERHDASVEREGVFDKAVAAIGAAKARGFKVTTNTTFFTHDSPTTVREVLDFLEGKEEFDCTAWGIPSYSLFGWQRPCYLMSDGYAETYKELIETTDWSKYGRGRDPRCENCMAHCGYEPTAVLQTARSLRQSLRALVS